ncbi:C-type lectin domain family 10 member A-like [Erinaceus europaeus]|uniref:C-type lectin domain family 10 member A-like n=1 Tax=Erinaceus europaeus TaxID=9365 RepID=A0A1S3W9H5_ERIEU|nr:C-type lectin domain family 10 member A-like [Erinaceus europaeus]
MPPPQSLLKYLCSGLRPVLLSLGLSLLLLVGICVIGSQNFKSQRDMVTMRAEFNNFSSNTTATVQALRSQGDNMQETITSLGTEMEKHKQEIQIARSLNELILLVQKELNKDQQEFKQGYPEMLQLVHWLVTDLKSLTCEVIALKSNGSKTSCCPLNWLEFEGSCYWFSRSGKPWAEAEKYCQLEDSHLVVINSKDEQNFVQKHIGFFYNTWIGLSDSDGDWKWVDGTDYETNFKNLTPGQPDNLQGHILGIGENCTYIHSNGKWNDDICERLYQWACETSVGKAS